MASPLKKTVKLTRVPVSTWEVTRRRSLLRLMFRQPHTCPEAQGPRLGVRRREALLHGQVEVGDAGAIVDDVHVDAYLGQVCLHAAALGVDDHVHLRLVSGDHGAADGLGVRHQLEMFLEGSGGVAGPLEIVALIW